MKFKKDQIVYVNIGCNTVKRGTIVYSHIVQLETVNLKKIEYLIKYDHSGYINREDEWINELDIFTDANEAFVKTNVDTWQKDFSEVREPLTLDKIEKNMDDFLISVSDEEFYNDYLNIEKAILKF